MNRLIFKTPPQGLREGTGMTTRRSLLLSLGGLALAGGAYAAGAFREMRRQAELRLFGQGSLIDTRAGALEYAVAGKGPPLMMIHGTGGGFDQGLLFATRLRQQGFRIIAPSRFGYLGSAFPDDASPAHQADTLVDLLDHLSIDRLPVLGGSAGALTAAEFALRHPDRCSQLALLVPAGNLTNRDPVVFTGLQRLAVDAVLGSDFWFWSLVRLTPEQMIRTLLATDPALLDAVPEAERQRAMTILSQILPISRKGNGLRTDAFWAGTPSATAFDRITVPTLILSCEDDLFGTAATARLMAERIPNAQITIYPTGGHIWLGHDADVADRIAGFVRGTAVGSDENQ
jgi:pimeloyl-ACP methyl ester carboxylesterase